MKMRHWPHSLVFFVVFCAALLRPLDAAAQINSGSFGGVTWYNAGENNTYALAVGDVNNDGFADIVVTNQHYLEDPAHTFTGVGIFINDGAGGFHLTSRYPTDGISGSWQSVKIADMDGDGTPDLVVLNSGNNGTCLPPACSPRSVSVMRGNGDGTFQAAVSHLIQNAPNTTLSVGKLAVADVNGDGKPDVIVGDIVSYAPFAFVDNFRTAVSVLINRGDGTFVSEALYDAGGTAEGEDLIAADVNGDGFQDVVFANECSQSGPTTPAAGNLCSNAGAQLPGTIGVLLGNGDGTFRPAATYASGGIVPGSLAAVDLNRDGRLDLLVTNGACFQCGGTTVTVLIGNGDGSFQAPVNYNNGAFAVAPVSVAPADVDGDGLADAAVLSFCGAGGDCAGTLSVLPGSGDGTLQAPAVYHWFSSALGVNPNTVVLADLNNDGKPDVVMGAWTAVGVMLNQTPRAATTTTLLSETNPAAFGQSVTFTAAVSSSSSGTPTGTVTFRDGAAILGSAPLAGGVATFSTSSLALGPHTIRASYSSDSNFRASDSAPLTELVKVATTTSIQSSANPSVEGQSVTFTAVVTAALGDAVGGSVIFKDGSTVLGSVAVSGNSAAAFSTSSLSAGTHAITAVYDGDSSHTGSTSSALNQTITVVPAITWNPPATIVSGAPLSSLQLNATANVAGTFVYAPPPGTLLALGPHTLAAVFTPSDPAHYSTAQAQVTIEVVSPGPPGPAAFHGIGDLPGGPFLSRLRDATEVGGVIYAVGGSAAHFQALCSGPNNPPGCVTQFSPDTSILWTWNGTSGTLTPLPDLATPPTPGINAIAASAITRDGQYLASQARSSAITPAATEAVRVARDTLATLNLGAAPFPTLAPPSAAMAISEDGSIVYGLAGNPSRAVRFDVNASSSTLIPLLSASDTGNIVAVRGASFDGSVAVGTSFVAPFSGSNGRAFRYVHGTSGDTVSAIPLLAGGTWNRAVAVSPDGRLVLLAGDSSAFPATGEMYVYDAVSGTTTALGSPNTPWVPLNLLGVNGDTTGGMTADGSVVVTTFGDPILGSNGVHTAYVHNAHGWFHLSTVLASQGIDISASGWSDESSAATGVSADGTLVFGSALHNDNTEGFVAELPAGVLAAFDVPPVPPADPSIVGTWTGPDSPQEALVFLNDGTYFHIDIGHGTQVRGEYSAGFERGRYTWDAISGQLIFATVQDTNGSIGLSGANGTQAATATVSGDTLTLFNGDYVLTRVTGPAGSIVSGWVNGDPRVDNDSAVLVLLDNGTFMFAQDGDSATDPGGHDGVEGGTYTWGAGGVLTVNVTIDTNGKWGFSNGPGTASVSLQLSNDELHLSEPGLPNLITRIVDPRTVVPAITSGLTAAGRVGSPFSYTITATHAATFDATGLPGGLSIDAATGIISGVPAVSGVFTAAVSATNSFGGTGTASLVITIDPRFAATTVSAAPASGTFGGTTVLSATLASGGSPLPGELIVFSLNGTPVGSATSNGAGVATLSGASLAGILAGSYVSGVQAAFGGDGTYAPSSGTAALTVSKATPGIVWSPPAGIIHGTPLDAAQLNATTNVPGTFAYTPPAGTILPVGAAQTLSVLFTPTDVADYTTAQAAVAITVTGAAPVAHSVAITMQAGVSEGGTLLATDADGVGVTFSIVTPPSKGTLTLLDAATGAFTYTPNAGALGYDTFTFRAAAPSGASTTATGMAFVVAASPNWPGQTVRASVSSAGAQGTDRASSSNPPALSADGRYVAFASAASNLVAGDTNGAFDAFVLDRATGVVSRVSVSSAGTQASGGDSGADGVSISADGRFVAFTSRATNLVAGDTNATEDIFVYDRQAGITTRVNVATDGTQANSSSFRPVLSADGRYVAFESAASNLVAGDTNLAEDVFVHDMQTGQTIRASVASDGAQASGFSNQAAISADGRYVAFRTNASNLTGDATFQMQDVFVHDLLTGATSRVSAATDGTPGNDGSLQPALSADGRLVAFYSLATNLVPGDTNGLSDVFVRDMQTGQTTRVSVSSGGAQGNNASLSPSLSADGRYIGFQSTASNLVPGDTNGSNDLFVYDRTTGQTTLVSVNNAGVQGNSTSWLAALSADGRYVGFGSQASNLVPADTNGTDDYFVTGGVTVSPNAISVPNTGATRSVNAAFDYPGTPWSATTTTPWITINPPNGGSASGTLSFTAAANSGAARSGTLTVALQTVTVTQDAASAPVAQNGAVTTDEDTPVHGTLNAADPNGDPLAFSLVTPPARGTVTIDNPSTGAFTYTPALNFNGRDSFTFQASDGHESSNIATMSVTINPVNDAPSVFDSTLQAVEDTPTNGFLDASDIDSLLITFSVVTPPAHGTVTISQPLGSPFGTSFIYTPNANYNGPDSFTFHAVDGTTTSGTATVSITVAPTNDPPVATSVVVTTQEAAPKAGTLTATDIDGDALTFSIVTPPAKGALVITNAATGAFTYTPNASAIGYDAFTFRATDPSGTSSTATGLVFIVAASPEWPGQTIRAGISTTGVQPSGSDIQQTYPPALSADGRYIAFSSLAPNVVGGDTNAAFDVFVLDRNTGVTTRASVSSGGVQGNASSGASRSISADGRFVAFSSSATNLVAGDTNGVQDIFVHDLQTGVTTRVSVASDGTQADADSTSSWISADGRYVAFVSTASNLVPGDTNGADDVFVRDLQTGQTIRASVATDGTQGNGSSDEPVMSADGRFVAFRSGASNLVAGDTNANFDVFVRDMQTGITTRVSVASDGSQGNGVSFAPVLSADGRVVAFFSSASNLVPADTNGLGDVFVRDLQTGQTTRASVASGGLQVNIGGASPALSADGRYVAFTSSDPTLVPGDTNNAQDVFVYDRQTSLTTRVSVGNDGSQGNGLSSLPSVSGDGRYIAFFSQASNLVSADTNSQADLFVVGGTDVAPTAIDVPSAGGSRSVNVSFAYPGTAWAASTTTPWITINSPNGGTTSGALSFTVAVNPGVARTGTITVALQTVTVTQAATDDVAPPVVTPPAPTTVYATVPGGATPGTAPALAAFLAGATAVDDKTGPPSPQPATLNGIAVTSTTVFAVGNNTVTFAFKDGAGNVGTAAAVVTVLAGRPSLSVGLVGVTVTGAGQQTVTLKLTNTGTGDALNTRVALSSLRTLTGTGTVTLASGLPVSNALLDPGETINLPIVVNPPSTVLRFALSLALTTTDFTGAVLSSTATQTIFPIDVTPPTVLNNGPQLVPARLSITVTWQTSEPATGGAAYGFGSSTNLRIADDGVYATSHTVTITGLAPNLTYSVIVTGHDAAGNVYNSVRKTVNTTP